MEAIVPKDLVFRLLEREEQAALPAPAGFIREMGGDTALSASRRSRDQHAGSAEVPLSAQHLVQGRDAARDPLVGDSMAQIQGRDRDHGHAALVDEEGVFVRPVPGAAELHDAHPARGDLALHPVIEQDDAVRDVLLEPLPCQRCLAALRRDDRGDPFVLQPAEEAPQLGAKNGGVAESGKQGLDGIEHDALRADAVDFIPDPNEEPLEVVRSSLRDVTALDVDVIHGDEIAFREVIEVEAEGAHVLRQFRGALLERDEEAGVAVLRGAANEEFGGKDCLAAPRGAADQRGTSERQTAARDFIEAFHSGGATGKLEGGVRPALGICPVGVCLR
jgi:hypothetical protein